MATKLSVTDFDKLFKSHKPLEDIEITPQNGWVLPNRTGFPNWMQQTFAYPNKRNSSKMSLFASQRLVKDFLQHESPYRGLLLLHGLGTGKTCASIVAAENLMNHMEVVVLLPASLEPNYVEEIKQKCGNVYFSPKQHWKFLDMKQIADIVSHVVKSTFVDESVIKYNKGIWIPTKEGTVNYNNLSDDHKAAINIQLESIVRNKFSFIHYNGLSKTLFQKDDKFLVKYRLNNKVSKSAIERVIDFENKLVIIDEVHNFISLAINHLTLGHKLYKMLLKTPSCRFILLSGTPVINYPHEIAYVINLLKGSSKVIKYNLVSSDVAEFDKIAETLDKEDVIDFYDIDHQHSALYVTLLERTRKDNADNIYVHRVDANTDAENVAKSLFDKLTKNGIKFTKKSPYTLHSHYPMPLSKDDFNSTFVDFQNNVVLNPRLFMRRCMGTVSFYDTIGDMYPTKLPTKKVIVPLSDQQFKKYEENRDMERKKEEQLKKFNRKGDAGDDVLKPKGQVYRAYTRATCNFVFPESIERPYPSKMKFAAAEIDAADEADVKAMDDWDKADIFDEAGIDVKKVKKPKKTKKSKKGDDADDDADDDEEEIVLNDDQKKLLENTKKQQAEKDKDAKKNYDAAIKKCLSSLQNDKQGYLKISNLKQFSPKFYKVVKLSNESPGKILVYSQFRTIEGLGVLSLALEANGWSEFKIKKDGDTWDLNMTAEELSKPCYFQFKGATDETKMLMTIFNSDKDNIPSKILSKLKGDNLRGKWIKLIMITQSGSEGISLKHVRQVHILEPYWNEVRIDQVIGRAVRARSHIDLKSDEQNVQIYRYVATFTKEQLKSSFTIQNQDGGLTSDEYIYNVAERKANILGDILKNVKQAAIDCQIHYKNHAHTGIKCLSFPLSKNDKELAFTPDISKEQMNAEYNLHIGKKKVVNKGSDYKVIQYKGEKYVLNETNNKVFDYKQYKNKKLVKIGSLKTSNTGKKTVKLYGP
jgi:hypothetical protein